ncbi:MAG: hypothetical protein ACXWYO_07905, partial [Gaiellaceae bacterium]
EQPPEHKRRVVRGADIGSVLAGLKSLLLGGGAAAKVAATVAVVSASTVVAAAPVQQHRARLHAAPKPAAQALASHASAAPGRPAASVAGPAAAFPAKAGAHAHARPRLQLAAVAFAQIAGSATPDTATVEVPPEPAAIPPAAEPEPAPAAPASEQPAAPPAAVPPNDTGHAEPPQHAPAASASTTAPTDRTTSERSKAETSSGRFGDAKKDATSGQASVPKGGDAEQRKTSLSVGGPTTLPVVTMPVTVSTPVQTIQSTTSRYSGNQPASARSWGPFGATKGNDNQAGPPAAPAPPIATAPAPAPSPGSWWGNDSKGGDWRQSDSGTKGVSSPPAPVVAPPSTVTLPAPVQTLSSPNTSLPVAAPAGFQPGETATGKDRERWKGGHH